MDAMLEWLDGPGASVGEAIETAESAIEEFIDALDHRDPIAIRAACSKSADPLIDQLPAELPTPDPASLGCCRR